MKSLAISAQRLWASITELATVGGYEDPHTGLIGVRRPALSDADAEARRLLAEWPRNADLAMRVDQMGNIYARREGQDPDASVVHPCACDRIAMRSLGLFVVVFLTACAGPRPRPSIPDSKSAVEIGPATQSATTTVPQPLPDEPEEESWLFTRSKWARSRAKVLQCNGLIDVINEAQGPLNAPSAGGSNALEKLATALEGASEKIRAIELTDDKLIEFRADYAKMVDDLVAAAKESASALESSDLKRTAAAAKKMKEFGPRETKLVDEINAYCGG